MKSFSLLLFVLGCMACNDRPIDQSPGSKPMGFTIDVAQSRTEVATTDNIQNFGVSAYYTGIKTWSEVNSTAAANYMVNQEVKRVDVVWTYSPLKYWPASTSEMITFFAYCPYGTDQNGVTFISSAAGAPTLIYTMPTDARSGVDLLAADNQQDCTNVTSSVKFSFKHILARVNFSITNNKSTAVWIKSISMSSVGKKGRYSFDTKSWTLDSDNATEELKLTFAGNGIEINSQDEVAILGTDYLMIIPQPFDGVTLTLNYSLPNEQTETPLSIPLTHTLIAGEPVNYKLSIPQ